MFNLQVVAKSLSLNQLGTFLAFSNYEEDKTMPDSHLPVGNSNIMVIDDEPEIVKVVCVMLEGEGFNMKSANSGPELFASLEKEKPELIILDVMMPLMDGLEVLTRLKEETSTASIPVILLTGNAQHDDVLGGYKTGAEYYIMKPFTKGQLLEGVNYILG